MDEDCDTMDERNREIIESYMSTLSDLVWNSKPHINALTMLAEDSINNAPAIVKAIETHLHQVRGDIKLPVLYVIDSIVKNVKGEYVGLFTKNIVKTFASVFEKVDEDTRANMYKLRQTWVGVFDENTLFTLDCTIREIDPAWPITAALPSNMSTGSIHINPRFFNQQNKAAPNPVKMIMPKKMDDKLMQEQLLQKQRELLQLQKQKIELELRQTEATLEQQNKQLTKKAMQLKDDLLNETATEATEKRFVAVAPNLAAKIIKQYPTASATLFKALPAKNGPKIAPAGSAVVASVKQVSRDPRLKLAPHADPVVASDCADAKLVQQPVPLAKPAAPAPAHPLMPITDIDNTNANNNTNKSSTTNKDASLHRSSQKKDSRLPSNLSGALSPSLDSFNSKPSPPKQQPLSSPSSGFKASKAPSNAEKRSRGAKPAPPQQDKERAAKGARDANDDYDPAAPLAEPDSDRSSSSPQPAAKRKSKSRSARKRSPSPAPYRIPKRVVADKPGASGVTEEEQSGSLIVSPPHPPAAFKDIRAQAKQRNYVRRNKDGSASPDGGATAAAQSADAMIDASNKDEDLRAALVIPPANEKKVDLDMRVVLPANTQKRQSTDPLDTPVTKKLKDGEFNDSSPFVLFGNEDTDLRQTLPQNVGRPPTPPPPVISGEDGKDGWAKIKPQNRSERDKASSSGDEKRERDRDRTRDRLGRPRLYSKLPDDPKERRRTLQTNEEVDLKSGRRGRENYDRNAEMNIESLEKIMKDAAEMLDQGSITKTQYNALIQEVLHMSEDRKLRAAQRKEKEIWDKGYDKGHERSHFGPADQDKFRPRNPSGPRWQGHPWQQSHFGPPDFNPGHFNPGFRPMGPHPWQNPPRHFNPIRPDFQFHPAFNPTIPPNPRMPGMMGPIGHNGPMITPGHMMNGPMHNMNPMMPAMGPNMNGPMGPMPPANKFAGHHGPRNQQGKYSPPNKYSPPPEEIACGATKQDSEVLAADPQILEQAAMDPTKSITIDGIPREIRYYGTTGVVFWTWNDPREIGFQNGVRRALINDKDSLTLIFNGPYQEFMFDGQVHKIRLGTPTRELYIDDQWYECCFGGMPTIVDLNGKKVSIKLEGPPPQVRISDTKRTDLVLGKINLIIDGHMRVPVFIDAKPQIIEIDGQPFTLEFIDSLRTVLINSKPFQFEFGGLPKSILTGGGKKHFLRFSVLPNRLQAGKVKITGMRGEPPSISPPISPSLLQKANTEAVPATHFNSPFDTDTSSQEAILKSDTQLDLLSSALPSAMAPASGLSYEAENPPAPTVPSSQNLDVNTLFQKLMDNGVFALFSNKKEETPKEEPERKEESNRREPEMPKVSFKNLDSIKTKHTNLFKKLYEGVQCSSCGARFAPDDMTTRYSHHLDWHFRQNRREKDTARKAHSRSWYYDVSDWIQFEEIEDLEDRAQSWFETERQSAEDGAGAGESASSDVRPSVPAGQELDPKCVMCHDAFEMFFDEEKEEWHLRPAVRFEDKNFHPLCLEDHKRALERSAKALQALEESFDDNEDVEMKEGDVTKESEDNADEEMKDESGEKPEAEGEIETENVEKVEGEVPEEPEVLEEEKAPEFEEDPDIIMEQIVDPSANKVIEAEIILDDEEEEEEKKSEEEEENLEVLHAQITPRNEAESENGPTNFSQVKIKEEPVDDEELDFTKVNIKQEPVDEIIAPDERLIIQAAAVIDTTPEVGLQSSIDGNVEIDAIPVTMPSIPSRIKININIPQRNTTSPKDKNESNEEEKPAEKTPVPEPEFEPASIKPALRGRKMSVIPPVEKDKDMSALCSIM